MIHVLSSSVSTQARRQRSVATSVALEGHTATCRRVLAEALATNRLIGDDPLQVKTLQKNVGME